MIVNVYDLWPGSHKEGDRRFFPQLTWEHYKQTFAQLDENPDTPDKDLAIYKIWHEMLISVFDELPTKDSTPEKGKAWRWEQFIKCAKRTHRFMREEGYQISKCTTGERPTVRINRVGKICVAQGNKRVALLQMIAEETGVAQFIEVEVLRDESEEWETLKLGVYPPGKPELYQPLPHPDFSKWNRTAAQPCTERWDMIVKQLPLFDASKVLDLGCHSGWFCRKFQSLGWSATGVDVSRFELAMAEAMEKWSYQNSNTSIEYKDFPIDEFLEILVESNEHFDVVLALSVLMHVGRDNPHDVTRVLQMISFITPVFFCDLSFGAYQKNLPCKPDEFVDHVLNHTKFTDHKILGHGQRENRPLHLFTRY